MSAFKLKGKSRDIPGGWVVKNRPYDAKDDAKDAEDAGSVPNWGTKIS